MKLIKPIQKNAGLVNDIRSFNSEGAFKIWWLGQSGFLLKWKEKCLLFDPYLSDSLSIKYQHTDKPHTRMSELVLDPSTLDCIDVVTSSHNHTDHLDGDTLIPILKNNNGIQFVIPEANRDFVVQRVHCDKDFPIGLNEGTNVEVAGFLITGVPSAHNAVEKNEQGECKFMGYIVQFGSYSVYHSGDTVLFDGLIEILAPYKVDIALLPINGNKPERRVAGNLDPREAAALGKAMGAKLLIPHHYDLFEFNTEDPALFEAECRQQYVPYKVLRMGEGMIYRNH